MMFISTIGSSIQPIYAASSARINPDDMLTVLNDITVAGQSWENIGFDSEDIANIMQMQRKDDSYYESLNTDIARLCRNSRNKGIRKRNSRARVYSILCTER